MLQGSKSITSIRRGLVVDALMSVTLNAFRCCGFAVQDVGAYVQAFDLLYNASAKVELLQFQH